MLIRGDRAWQIYKIHRLVLVSPEPLVRSDAAVSDLLVRKHRHRKYKQDYQLKLVMIPTALLSLLGVTIAVAEILLLADPDKDHILKDYMMIGITQCINFAGACALVLMGIKLTGVRTQVVSMDPEIRIVACLWCVCSAIYHFRQIVLHNSEMQEDELVEYSISAVILYIRNLLCFFTTIAVPVLKSNGTFQIQYTETRECASGAEIALSTELPFAYFVTYLRSVFHDSGKNLVSLYMQLKVYEHKVGKGEVEESFAAATEIMGNFVEEGAPCVVEGIPKEVREALRAKFLNLANYLDRNLFDPVYAVAIEALKRHFQTFKLSDLYRNLMEELRKRETIYERCLSAELL